MALATRPATGALAGFTLVRGQGGEGARQRGQQLEHPTPRPRRGQTRRDPVEAIAVHAQPFS
jgi:hypothetical protein